MGIVPVGRVQHVVISSGVGDLLTAVLYRIAHRGKSTPIDQAIDERRIGILIDLLDPAGELVRGLGPVVIFHCDHEDCFDLLCTGVHTSQWIYLRRILPEPGNDYR